MPRKSDINAAFHAAIQLNTKVKVEYAVHSFIRGVF